MSCQVGATSQDKTRLPGLVDLLSVGSYFPTFQVTRTVPGDDHSTVSLHLAPPAQGTGTVLKQ